MSRYIDKDKLIENLNYFAPEHHNALINDLITKQPEADVVEVVRCKDCIFSRELNKFEKLIYLDSCVRCAEMSTSYDVAIMNKNDYCSYGERKEN